jgi:hypothetical protein
MNAKIRLTTLGLVAVLALSGCSAQTDAYGNKSNSSTSVTAPKSGSSEASDNSSSSSSSGSALADCKAYQSGYNSMRFSDFLETEWDAFQSGAVTKFKSQEFLSLWTRVRDESFPTWDDVGYVVYELCWDAANFEITIPIVEEESEPAQPSVEYVEVPDFLGAAFGKVRPWLTANGYKFNVTIWEMGFNPSTACLTFGEAPVLKQSPESGTVVENSFGTNIQLWKNCER